MKFTKYLRHKKNFPVLVSGAASSLSGGIPAPGSMNGTKDNVAMVLTSGAVAIRD